MVDLPIPVGETIRPGFSIGFPWILEFPGSSSSSSSTLQCPFKMTCIMIAVDSMSSFGDSSNEDGCGMNLCKNSNKGARKLRDDPAL